MAGVKPIWKKVVLNSLFFVEKTICIGFRKKLHLQYACKSWFVDVNLPSNLNKYFFNFFTADEKWKWIIKTKKVSKKKSDVFTLLQFGDCCQETKANSWISLYNILKLSSVLLSQKFIGAPNKQPTP